ncbi:MAG: DNA/RNA non-specific endonuclease [Alphaproteobacteria bacterium]|nr:DNA/RNA non-specific endonuclease [Alphaproteobacteria bacterium]
MRVLVLTILLLAPNLSSAASLKPINLSPDYNHDKYVTLPKDIVFAFRAYLSSFDSDGNGVSEPWGIPDFVAYEIKEYRGRQPKGPDRPSPWIHDQHLVDWGLMPTDATYAYSRAFRQANPDWYVRGHLAMKQHAWRLGAEADWNTHTMMNAVPQRNNFNKGIWLDLEIKTANWADKYGTVWIVDGPIMLNGRPRDWIGEPSKNEIQAAVPDALFKIVIKESDNELQPDVLAFIYPQDDDGYGRKPYNHTQYLVSVDEIEGLTGLDFLTILPDDDEAFVEDQVAEELWDQGR